MKFKIDSPGISTGIAAAEVIVMELIKTDWNIVVLLFSLSYFVVLGRITYELGMSAINLHEKGLISLGDLNRQLMSGGKNTRRVQKNKAKNNAQKISN